MAPVLSIRTPRVPRGALLLRRVLRLWSSDPAGRLAASLVALAGGALFLSSTATLEVGYTLRVSQILLATAVLVGAPFAWQAWCRMPDAVRWSTVALLAAYVAAAWLGQEAVIAAGTRSGSTRDLAYISDLGLGLAVIALIAGLSPGHLDARRLALVIAAGAGLAALYGLYQWPAQQFDWPLADVNNTLDSNGATAGGSQGAGILGWDRIRGTFLEPHFLGAYMASVLPLAAFGAWAFIGPLRVLMLAVAAFMVVVLALAGSLSSWMVLALGLLIGGALTMIARGWVLRSAWAGAVVVLALAAAPLALLAPERLAAATGREASELTISSDFRSKAWEHSLRTWSERPILGFGPGQSAVRSVLDSQGAGQEPVGQGQALGSSHGLWAASLVDTGVLGFGIWCIFLCAILAIGAMAFLRKPEPLLVCAFTAAVVAVVGGEVAGDRLDLRVWVLLGLLLGVSATSRGNPRPDRGESRGQPKPRTP